MVKFCSCRLAGMPNSMALPLALNRKAWPTLPEAKLTLPRSVPELLPNTSSVLFSARHQLTKPDGGSTQLVGGGSTLNVATELVTAPARLVTNTEYGPASLSWTFCSVSVGSV